jgi:signal transduction histidine kinase
MDLSRFTIGGEKDRVIALNLQNARLIRLRWFYISMLPAIAAFSNYATDHPEAAKRYIFIGIAGLLLNAVLFYANTFIKRVKLLQALMVLQLSVDLSLAAIVTYQQGGTTARTTALFVLPIVAAGLIFTYRVVYLAALMSGIAYALAVILFSSSDSMPHYLSEVLVPLVFYPAYFMIFAQLVVYLLRVATQDTREQAYDAFLALLSHQLKHPVSTVNAIIDQLEHGDIDSPETQKKYINMLKAENRNLLLLLNNLLETAAPVTYINEAEEVDLPALLQKVTYQSAENHSRTADLKLKLKDMSLTVKANSGRLSIAITDVIDNAFQYSKSGSPVIVSLRRTRGNAIIMIEDKGGPMDKRSRRQLFQKYNQHEFGEGGIQGLGLGLFVAKKVITEHHGTLRVLNDRTGTKVVIILKRGKKA